MSEQVRSGAPLGEPRRILFVEHTADMVGGGQQSLLHLLKFLNRDLYDPLVVLPGPGTLTSRVEAMGVPVALLDMEPLRPGHMAKAVATVFALRRLVRQHRVQVVHTNASRTTLFAGLATRLLGVPLVWNVRIATPQPLYDRVLYLLADKVIAISNAVARRFTFRGNRKKVCVIYNGIDLESFFPVDALPFRRRFGLEGKIVIGQVGQLEPIKGPGYLLKAFEGLSGFYPDAHLLFVGAPTAHQRELEMMGRDLGLTSRITFAGQQADVREAVSALDILVVPSETEGFGRVLIEAMACERPIVAFAVDAIPEVLGHGDSGILVEKGDIHGLANGIRSLLEDPVLKKELVIEGRKRVARYYDIRKTARQTEIVYELCAL
ncbi:MAG: glycosyltransferase family 4 protein [bacterium]|nr:glycosyltransferase family 4 protein [bacterium]